MSFSAIGLSAAVMQGVAKSGYSSPTEIQRKAIPLAIAGKDIIGCAPTGTGKTAAFVLPILDRLQQKSAIGQHHRFPRALILTPTRELAQQIDDSIRIYGKFTGFRSLSVYGGVGIGGQLSCLRQGIDIVVATPGRLLDHLERNSIDLSHIEFLVLDEADRMFDMGFINAVRAIIAKVPKERQTMLFSATISREVRDLVAGIQKNPLFIEIGEPFSPVATVEQHFFCVSQHSKTDLLVHILDKEKIETMLVFSRTKHGADKIAKRLAQCGISRPPYIRTALSPSAIRPSKASSAANIRCWWPPTLRPAASTSKGYRMLLITTRPFFRRITSTGSEGRAGRKRPASLLPLFRTMKRNILRE